MQNNKLENLKSNLQEFYNYILITNNISSIYNITDKQLKEYIRYSLNIIKTKCYKSILLREKRQEVRDDIDDLERMYVKADNLDISEAGKNTGGKENDVELRHIKIKQLKEELERLTNQSLVLEKSLQEHKEMFRNIFDTCLTEAQATIMKLFYIDCWTTLKIATELYYTRDYIRQIKNRAINRLMRVLLLNSQVQK